MLVFSDCEIETVTIEARYEPALALWDRVGEIWTEVQSQFPELQSQNAMPGQQIFESPDTSAVTELEAFRVTCRGDNAEWLVIAVSQKLLDVCSDRLKLAVFTRIGFRELRSRKFGSIDEANSEISPVLAAAIIGGLIPDSKFTALASATKQEGKTNGLATSIRTETRETKVTIPWAVRDRIRTDLFKEHLAIFDSDYYTVGVTRRESLHMEE